MIYCPNPDCTDRQNNAQSTTCATCGTYLTVRRYQLIEPLQKLSSSGCAEVFTVEDLYYPSSPKVMKTLRVPNQKSSEDQKSLQLFDREAKVLESLDHQDIPKMEANGYFSFETALKLELKCLVMEKIDGVNLDQWLKENQCCPPNLALQWMKQLVDILEYLHRHKLLHRDIKPTNIILKPDNKIALVDFGAAKQITTDAVKDTDSTRVYTSGYAPDEQRDGHAVPQSDFYALGRTFVHLLTGRTPRDPNFDIHKWRLHLPKGFPEEIANLIDSLMAQIVTKRPKCTATIRRQLKRIEKKQASPFWNSKKFPKRFHLPKITNAISLIIVMWILAWELANNWNLIFPSSTQAALSSIYQKNCKNIEISKGNLLSAKCQASSGKFNTSSILIQGIQNKDGVLNFTRLNVNSSYQRSCWGIHVNGATLSAKCKKINGEPKDSTILIPGIKNTDGKLTY